MIYLETVYPGEHESAVEFANRTRILMANRLEIPTVNWTRETGFLFEEVTRLNLNPEIIVGLHKGVHS